MTSGSSRYKLVIYDCDGVMFDSFEANLAFYNLIMQAVGRPPLDRSNTEHMRVLHTYSNRDVLAYLFSEEAEFQAAAKAASAIDYRGILPFMQMEAGFRETLETLYPSHHLAVCTNRSTSMDAVLDSFDLSRYFGCVMTAARVTNPKPHPEPLLKVLEHYSVRPEEALFVGDSILDHQASRGANIPFLAYKTDLPGIGRIDRHSDIFGYLSIGAAACY